MIDKLTYWNWWRRKKQLHILVVGLLFWSDLKYPSLSNNKIMGADREVSY
jgi:hypothetical protein